MTAIPTKTLLLIHVHAVEDAILGDDLDYAIKRIIELWDAVNEVIEEGHEDSR